MNWTQGGGGEERSQSDDVAEDREEADRVQEIRHDLDDLEVKVDRLKEDVEAIRDKRGNHEEE